MWHELTGRDGGRPMRAARIDGAPHDFWTGGVRCAPLTGDEAATAAAKIALLWYTYYHVPVLGRLPAQLRRGMFGHSGAVLAKAVAGVLPRLFAISPKNALFTRQFVDGDLSCGCGPAACPFFPARHHLSDEEAADPRDLVKALQDRTRCPLRSAQFVVGMLNQGVGGWWGKAASQLVVDIQRSNRPPAPFNLGLWGTLENALGTELGVNLMGPLSTCVSDILTMADLCEETTHELLRRAVKFVCDRLRASKSSVLSEAANRFSRFFEGTLRCDCKPMECPSFMQHDESRAYHSYVQAKIAESQATAAAAAAARRSQMAPLSEEEVLADEDAATAEGGATGAGAVTDDGVAGGDEPTDAGVPTFEPVRRIDATLVRCGPSFRGHPGAAAEPPAKRPKTDAD